MTNARETLSGIVRSVAHADAVRLWDRLTRSPPRSCCENQIAEAKCCACSLHIATPEALIPSSPLMELNAKNYGIPTPR